MKCIILFLITIISTQVAMAQQPIVHITPDQLFERIGASDKPTVVQYWIASCANAEKVVEDYKTLERDYGSKIDFYFIAITNKDSLVDQLKKNVAYPYALYIAEQSIEKEIYNRKKVFSFELCKLLRRKEKDFITLYLNKNDQVVYAGEDTEVKLQKLNKLI